MPGNNEGILLGAAAAVILIAIPKLARSETVTDETELTFFRYSANGTERSLHGRRLFVYLSGSSIVAATASDVILLGSCPPTSSGAA